MSYSCSLCKLSLKKYNLKRHLFKCPGITLSNNDTGPTYINTLTNLNQYDDNSSQSIKTQKNNNNTTSSHIFSQQLSNNQNELSDMFNDVIQNISNNQDHPSNLSPSSCSITTMQSQVDFENSLMNICIKEKDENVSIMSESTRHSDDSSQKFILDDLDASEISMSSKSFGSFSLTSTISGNSTTDSPLNELESSALKYFVEQSLPLSSFDSFVKIFMIGRESNNMSFSDKDKKGIYYRLISKLSKLEDLKRHCFTFKTLVYNNIQTKLPVFPFLDNIQWLLTEKDLMSNGLLQYDSESKDYGEMNTGEWWCNAEKRLEKSLENMKLTEQMRHILVPLLFFIDKVHVTTNGKLRAEGVLCSIGNIPIHQRKRKKAWFNLGFIPQKDIQRRKNKSPNHLLDNYYQEALGLLLEDVLQANLTKEGFPMYIYGIKEK